MSTRLCRFRIDFCAAEVEERPRSEREKRATRSEDELTGLRGMRRQLVDGIVLDDDPGRIDVDAVHDFLANHSYWAEGRPRETVARLVREAQLVVGLYDGPRQIGFARAFTDGTSIVYLADVYVLPEYRGRGLGVELVREIVENGSYAHRRWLLHTRDAHALYRCFGFAEPSKRVMEREPR